MLKAIYPMRVVTEQTGLSPHVIRVWERRYRAVVPHRTETNRRLYTRADIDRLLLLRRAVDRGHAIGRIAGMPDEELKAILEIAPPMKPPSEGVSEEVRSSEEYLRLALEASRDLDAKRLEDLLGRAEMDLGRYVLVDVVIGELLEAIGELWRKGEIRPSQEHLTSSVVRNILGNAILGTSAAESAPAIVLATPSDHLHELGCLMAGVVAVMQGWRVVYLGSSLPAEEIVGATIQTGARAVGLSLVYPASNRQTLAELSKLLKLLPPETALLVGGRVAYSYRQIEADRVRFLDGFEGLQSELERLAS